MMSFTKALVCLVLVGCSGLQQSQQRKWRQLNAKEEKIARHHADRHYPITTPRLHVREKYPWELAYLGKHPKITKEFFRCKGSGLNPPRLEGAAHILDCGGFQK